MSDALETLVRSLADEIANDVFVRVNARLAASPGNPWMTTKEVAAYMGMAPISLEIWRIKGKGPIYHKLGRNSIRYRRADVDQFMARDRRQSTSAPLVAAKPLPKKKQKRRAA